MQKNRWLGILLFACAAFVLIIYLNFDSDTKKDNALPVAADRVPDAQSNAKQNQNQINAGVRSDKSAVKNLSSPATQYFESSLPQADSPLATTFDALKRSADQGNYWAACRLAADVHECSVHSFLQTQLSMVQRSATETGRTQDEIGSARREVSFLKSALSESEKLCTGYSARDTRDVEPWKYLLQAALAGHAPSKAAFVMRPPVNISNMFSNIEFADAYKGNAPSFLMDAANAGVLDAAEGVAWSSLGPKGQPVFQPGYGLQLLPIDYYKAAVFDYASSGMTTSLQGEVNPREDLRQRVEAVTTPEQRARAKSEAGALVASWRLNRNEQQAVAQSKSREGNYKKMCAN